METTTPKARVGKVIQHLPHGFIVKLSRLRQKSPLSRMVQAGLGLVQPLREEGVG